MSNEQEAMNEDEFYVGYLPKASKRTASFVRKAIALCGLSICVVAIVFAWTQKKFSASVFDYGINSTVEGYYSEMPVPHLAVPLGTNNTGERLFQNVLLVGFGKAGADDVMMKLANKNGNSFEGKKIKLTGFMIYGNGKALLQVTEEDNLNIAPIQEKTLSIQPVDSSGITSLQGEIVDPKCYFGVMKPGEGKGHRSCAIRCIAGGIPPVFYARDRQEYFLIVNETGQPMNNEVLGLVGDQISIMGKEIVWNDWKILKVNTKDLAAITSNKTTIDQVLAFETEMTMCANNRK